MGYENRTKHYIIDYIEQLQKKRMETLKIDADYVLKRLVEVDQLDVLDIMTDDLNLKPLSQWPKQWRTLISGIELTRFEGDEDVDPSILSKIKWPEKTKNLALLGKHINVRAWEKETTVKVENNIMPLPTADSAEDWEKVAKKQQEDILSDD